MPTDIKREQITFPSTDGISTVYGFLWWPAEDAKPRGVVQLVHGMAEHIERYDDFARYLAGEGFLVAGHDQIGHGRTTPPEHWGELPIRNGAEILVEDVDKLRKIVQKRIGAEIPYFLFGHSMGSFEVRSYIARHAEGLAGAIICGTGYVAPAASKFAKRTSWLSSFLFGENHHSKLIDSMGAGSYSRAIENARTDFDWLSYNRDNVDRYIADPACGFMFSTSGYVALTTLTAEVNTLECASQVPSDLPLLFISGGDDPVGGFGEGVRHAAALARDGGSEDVVVTIYGNMRHEILNEDDHMRVYGDVKDWIVAHMPQDDGKKRE
ncbi:MAG: alpha/beta fold hydrolase [Tractidigestivibacter sp.]|jgi:alpha-beta hydrolase superfamily lysophospholipase|uniref:alpha/beta fold hydrolase n=1 Tax=Tractidigestivibacter sp. TaxID=2847320 RepID=UPI003D922F94